MSTCCPEDLAFPARKLIVSRLVGGDRSRLSIRKRGSQTLAAAGIRPQPPRETSARRRRHMEFSPFQVSDGVQSASEPRRGLSGRSGVCLARSRWKQLESFEEGLHIPADPPARH